MANGFSDKEMIQMILDGQGKIQEQIDGLVQKVDQVISQGCAHRPDDMRRVQELEAWRTRGIIGVIITLITSIGALIGMIVSPGK